MQNSVACLLYLYSGLKYLQLSSKLTHNFKSRKITDANFQICPKFSKFASNFRNKKSKFAPQYKNPLKSAMTFFSSAICQAGGKRVTYHTSPQPMLYYQSGTTPHHTVTVASHSGTGAPAPLLKRPSWNLDLHRTLLISFSSYTTGSGPSRISENNYILFFFIF